jgi:hypothetical protein
VVDLEPARDLFRAHISGSADNLAGGRDRHILEEPGDAEVDQPDFP